MIKTSEELRPYISVCANIRLPMKEAGLPLDVLAAHGRSMMRWRLDNQDGFADSLYNNVWEARHDIEYYIRASILYSIALTN